jgi:hypothetical protein
MFANALTKLITPLIKIAMKKLFTSAILFVTACLVLSSCAEQLSTISVAKRHYRNGYYVNIHNNKPVELKTKEMKSFLPEAYSLASIDKKEDTKNDVVKNEKSTDVPEFPLTASASTDNSKHRNTTTSIIPHKAKLIKMLVQNSAKIKNIVSSDTKNVKKIRSGGGLIWTIIVILLVLWLISFLAGGFGLGGLLYLLLVVALVLLLLRILGIV